MNYKIYLVALFTMSIACSEKEKEDVREKTPIERKDTSDIIEEQDLSKDIGPDMSETKFADPNRVRHEPCSVGLDCARFEYCDGGRCSYLTGCGFYGRPPAFDEDRACIIDEFGIGRLSGKECDSDDMCPKEMPYCYLRACQTQPRCKVDSDCAPEQFCDYETWCATLPPCESDDDCDRGSCAENGKCAY